MKRILVLLGFVVFIIAGCTEKTEDNNEKNNEEKVPPNSEKVEVDIQQFVADASTFHFVVDWLSDEEILFVEKQADIYRLKTFNIYTKDIRVLYEDKQIIADVRIHPVSNDLLIQTTASPTAATVKVISLEGVVLNEVSIESAELAIEWNDLDPAQLLLTAFYEDWSYDVFYFNGGSNDFSILPIEDPFPKWLGLGHFVLADAMDKERLAIYDVQSGAKEFLEARSVLTFDTFKNALLIAQLTTDELVNYSIINENQDLVASWGMPFSESEEWGTFPAFQWIDEMSGMAIRPAIDEQSVETTYELVKFEGENETIIMEGLENTSLVCSPNQKLCLTGTGLAQILDLEEVTKTPWLQLKGE